MVGIGSLLFSFSKLVSGVRVLTPRRARLGLYLLLATAACLLISLLIGYLLSSTGSAPEPIAARPYHRSTLPTFYISGRPYLLDLNREAQPQLEAFWRDFAGRDAARRIANRLDDSLLYLGYQGVGEASQAVTVILGYATASPLEEGGPYLSMAVPAGDYLSTTSVVDIWLRPDVGLLPLSYRGDHQVFKLGSPQKMVAIRAYLGLSAYPQ